MRKPLLTQTDHDDTVNSLTETLNTWEIFDNGEKWWKEYLSSFQINGIVYTRLVDMEETTLSDVAGK